MLVTRPEYHDILTLAQQFNVSTISVASKGSGESIAAAVQQTRAWSGWLIQPGDMAWVTAQDHLRVSQSISEGVEQVRLCWQQIPGHPVGFSHGYGEALSRLTGDRGARELLDPAKLRTFDAHAGVIRDADLPTVTSRS